MATKAKAKSTDCGCYPSSDDGWKARMDLETLMSAAEIQADPKRLAAAKKEAKKRAEELKATMERARKLA